MRSTPPIFDVTERVIAGTRKIPLVHCAKVFPPLPTAKRNSEILRKNSQLQIVFILLIIRISKQSTALEIDRIFKDFFGSEGTT